MLHCCFQSLLGWQNQQLLQMVVEGQRELARQLLRMCEKEDSISRGIDMLASAIFVVVTSPLTNDSFSVELVGFDAV
jgi:hypothetical protein